MTHVRLAIATAILQQPIRASLEFARKVGVRGVLFDLRQELPPVDWSETALRDLRHLMRQLDLQIAATTLSLRRPLYDEHELDRRIKAIRDTMSFASLLGSRVLTLTPGEVPADRSSPHAKILRDVLLDLASHGNHVGVVLALHDTHSTPQVARDWANSISTGPVQIDFNPLNWMPNPAVALRELALMVSHVQCCDGRMDFGRQKTETRLGEGQVVWPEIFATLNEMDYSGWVTVTRSQSAQPQSDLAASIEYLKQLVPGL